MSLVEEILKHTSAGRRVEFFRDDFLGAATVVAVRDRRKHASYAVWDVNQQLSQVDLFAQRLSDLNRLFDSGGPR
jgi:hypothetical protein